MTEPPPKRLDMNCDLGEGEPSYLTGALMGCVSSVNIACGGHAGDRRTIRHALELARKLGVQVGAHPGLRGNFGRGEMWVSPGEFRTLLCDQLDRFCEIARRHGVTVHHVKLHGTLYHATENDEAVRSQFLTLIKERFPHLIIYALAGGKTVMGARSLGLPAWDEAFADRAYRDDGSLLPRGEPGALITNPVEVVKRVKRLAAGRPIRSRSGTELTLPAKTVCLHADSPHSLAIAQALHATLDG